MQAQFKFLRSLNDERFRELQAITGAYQGEGKINRNQLLDAFHLWCAEGNGCDLFLVWTSSWRGLLKRQNANLLFPSSGLLNY